MMASSWRGPGSGHGVGVMFAQGARLLSPCGSQITITLDAGPGDSAPGDEYELKWEFDEDSQ